eukprot:2018603-Rhodomonas_salina.1
MRSPNRTYPLCARPVPHVAAHSTLGSGESGPGRVVTAFLSLLSDDASFFLARTPIQRAKSGLNSPRCRFQNPHQGADSTDEFSINAGGSSARMSEMFEGGADLFSCRRWLCLSPS